MNDNNQDTPSAITGGCLCSAIRYTVNFNEEYPWPPTSSACQCTMCRKWTSSLIAQFLVISPKQISPALGTFASFKEYMSSPGRFRGFCGDCGTSLTWRSADYTPIFDLYLGTLDEKYLVGDGVVAKTLATPNGTQYWMQNSIHVKGKGLNRSASRSSNEISYLVDRCTVGVGEEMDEVCWEGEVECVELIKEVYSLVEAVQVRNMTVDFAETDSPFARRMNPVRSKELAVVKLPNIVIELVEEEGLLGALSILLQPK
ncbi:Mss4-like protein [Fusarium oxysporum Fo47]|uniref:Mss4-like protein n=1 Tax=Fusarium oxysporum Fo47 TaxID=660027 RepID=UPI002869E051|nr:Mss4-like protein [Fusarium oxysporum Fo47]QKD58626.2 Mss4-like protein [Fusarium oxysporum Fo47]